jgi:hypothetical protein
MASRPQIEEALKHLAREPYGFRVFRTGERRTGMTVNRLTGNPSVVSVSLTTGGLADAQIKQLEALGWISADPEDAGRALRLRKPVAAKLDPGSLLVLATSTLDIATGLPITEGDLQVNETSDAGWAQAGCVFAAPGMVLGGLAGLAASAHATVPLPGGVSLAILVFLGASIAYLGGGLIANSAYRLAARLPFAARNKAGVAMVAWLIGSVLTPLIVGSLIWSAMGW